MKKEEICKYCGEHFISIRKANNKFTKYCSSECSLNDRFGKEISDGTFTARSEAGLAALHLVRSGHVVTSAARETGVHPFALHSLIRKNKSVFSGRTCKWCEKPLIGMKELSVRLYCSAKCKDAVKQSIKRRKNPPYKLAALRALREEGILLYKEGYSINEISKLLEVGTNRVGGWVEYFFGKNEKAFLEKRNSAKTADEWLQTLREFNPNQDKTCESKDARAFILVCGQIYGNLLSNNLVSKVYDELKLNVYSGDTFVFCNRGKNTLTVLFWDGAMFITTKFPRGKFTYIWPHDSIGAFVAAYENDFKFILSYYKNNQASRLLC